MQPHPRQRWVAQVGDGRVVAQAGATQAQASLLSMRRASIASGVVWTTSGRLSSEHYANFSVYVNTA